jgi:hypothetical protein
MTAPQFYIGYFGLQNSERDFRILSNQLSYIPGMGARNRVVFPAGYAPFDGFDKLVSRMVWDDVKGHPDIARNLTVGQESRIKALFTTKNGYVEPFPASNLQLAISISEEKPPPSAAPMAPKAEISKREPERQADGLHISANSYSALAVGFLFVAFVAWLSAAANRFFLVGKPSFWREVSIETVSSIVSTTVLYTVGVVTEIKWLSVPLLGGLLSVVLTSSAKHTA